MKNLGADTDSVGNRRRSQRHHHVFLEIDAGVGVAAAVEDVHHRHRQHMRVRRQGPIERDALGRGRGVGRCERNTKHRIGAQMGLVLGAVEFEQALVQTGLVVGVAPPHLGRDQRGDVADRLQHALAAVTLGVAVAQLQRLVDPG